MPETLEHSVEFYARLYHHRQPGTGPPSRLSEGWEVLEGLPVPACQQPLHAARLPPPQPCVSCHPGGQLLCGPDPPR